MTDKPNRPSPSQSASLYKIGTKKTGNDGNVWIITANKNGIKKWTLFKKVQITSVPNLKSKSKPRSYNLNVKFMAEAMLWNDAKHKSFDPKKILSAKDLPKVLKIIHEFPELNSGIKFYFKKVLTANPKIKWTGTNVVVAIPVKIKSGMSSYEDLLSIIEKFRANFSEVATYTYLEGDAVVYQLGPDRYEYILDNIKFDITHNDKLLRHISYLKYWK